MGFLAGDTGTDSDGGGSRMVTMVGSIAFKICMGLGLVVVESTGYLIIGGSFVTLFYTNTASF